MKEILNFIDGDWKPALSLQWLECFEPATGLPYARLPDSDADDVELAAQAAQDAFPGWSSRGAAERSEILRKIAAGIRARLEELALAESIDNGKPLHLARSMDIPRSAQNMEFFADAATQCSSEFHSSGGSARGLSLNYTERSPLGTVGCISPWNLPLYLFTWKIAPALAFGNTVLAKPSEITPMTAFLFSKIAQEAGVPRGVLNLVHGTGPKVGAVFARHPQIKAVSFTGSTATGRLIAQEAAPRFKKFSLEMGGKNAFVVFKDSDLPKAAVEAVRAAFTNQGEICLCGSRILIERPIYESFRDQLVERTRALRVGDPLESSSDQGALVSRAHYEKVLSALETARKEGGRILCGGNAARPSGRCEKGWFIEPTLIEGLGPQCDTNQNEIFGPVATLTPFDTEEEALAIVNGTRYGLAASIFTGDLSRAHRMSAALEVGVVWINCWMKRDLRTPFGGVKDSGFGREGGGEAMRFFTEPKNICIEVQSL